MIELTPPNGCRHCGIPRDRHFAQFYTKEVGWHAWTAPSQRMIKERMIARWVVWTGTPWRRWGRRS